MNYQVLARKWRPRYFHEVRGQAHITRTLINSIKNNKIGHAYLLTGTRGIGKTTIARIFAKAIRCEQLSQEGEPCLRCDSCTSIDSSNSLDYLEIDGASNNSVDNIRELIENVQYLPTNGKYKVYVIDEVHMLSTSAFNALLKTLEEPPEHAVFIFATTDPQKLLGTVLSRCQRFDFKNSTIEETKNLLLEIAKNENISFESESLVLELAKQGRGSFRDSLSLFDQVISLSETNIINEDTLMLSLGMAKVNSIFEIVNAILLKDKIKVREVFKAVIAENIDLKIFSKQVLDKFYEILVSIDNANTSNISDLNSEILESVSLVEVLWIYENLSKDLDWAIKSFDAERACCFSLIKMSLREKIINQNTEKITVKKKPNDSGKIIEKNLSWDGFLKYLYETRVSLAINLERGNILNLKDLFIENAILKIAFSDECQIFYDYLSEPNNKIELINSFAAYANKEISNIHFDLAIIEKKEVEQSNFKSSVQIVEDKIEREKETQTDLILKNKYIQDAQEVFNSEINEVILNEDK